MSKNAAAMTRLPSVTLKANVINKIEVSNPLQYSNGLLIQSNVEKTCFVLRADADKILFGDQGEPLTPYLVWVYEDGTPIKSFGGLPVDGYGWALCLSGLNAQAGFLGHALWDEPKEIKNLVNLLEDKDALLTLASLTYPDEMAKATQNLSIFKILDKNKAKLAVASSLIAPAIRRAQNGNRTSIYHTTLLSRVVAYSFTFDDVDWRFVFRSFTEKQKKRYKAKALRQVLEETGFHGIEGGGWTMRHYEHAMTPLSEADWSEITQILGRNPIAGQEGYL